MSDDNVFVINHVFYGDEKVKYQKSIDEIISLFPIHHVDIDTYPGGGMITLNSCEECGSNNHYIEVYGPRKKCSTIDEAILSLLEQNPS